MTKKNKSRWLNYLLPLVAIVIVLVMLPVSATVVNGSISIAAGSASAVGSFQADQCYSGGSAYKNSNTVSVSQITINPPPAALFNNERYGAMSYTIPGFTAGSSYTVTLYFAETYLTASGQRLFSVSINGSTVLSNFDIYASAGGQNKAIARSFTTTANSSGQIVIQFISGTQNPKINGISINPVGAPTPTTGPTPTPTRGAGPTPTPTRIMNNTPTPTQGSITIPPYSALPTIAKFPDPYKFMNGTRMTSKSQWEARRAEISALAQAYEFGTKPPIPANVTGSFSNNTLTVNVTENGKTISFNCSITYPSTGTKPYPAMIGINGSFLNNSTLSSLGVAVINFPTEDVANNITRGQGKFYTIYGSGHSAGSLIAWAWGVDCMITALEKTTAANIDPTRLGVTGCSRYGKGALIAAAFCDRIKLAIPQESGSGGAGNWRVADYVKSTGVTVETLAQIVNGDSWFTTSFSQFSSTATKLPYDHHQIIGLVAPRACLIIENTGIDYLCPVGCWDDANAAHWIWQALGVPDKMGYSGVSHGSSHCSFQSSQQTEVTAYVQKFLVGGGTGNTNVMKNDTNLNFDQAKWIDWTVPTLQ